MQLFNGMQSCTLILRSWGLGYRGSCKEQSSHKPRFGKAMRINSQRLKDKEVCSARRWGDPQLHGPVKPEHCWQHNFCCRLDLVLTPPGPTKCPSPFSAARRCFFYTLTQHRLTALSVPELGWLEHKKQPR